MDEICAVATNNTETSSLATPPYSDEAEMEEPVIGELECVDEDIAMESSNEQENEVEGTEEQTFESGPSDKNEERQEESIPTKTPSQEPVNECEGQEEPMVTEQENLDKNDTVETLPHQQLNGNEGTEERTSESVSTDGKENHEEENVPTESLPQQRENEDEYSDASSLVLKIIEDDAEQGQKTEKTNVSKKLITCEPVNAQSCAHVDTVEQDVLDPVQRGDGTEKVTTGRKRPNDEAETKSKRFKKDECNYDADMNRLDWGLSYRWKEKWKKTSLILSVDGVVVRMRISDSIVKVNKRGMAACTLCSSEISYGNKGKRPLIRHMQSKGHVQRVLNEKLATKKKIMENDLFYERQDDHEVSKRNDETMMVKNVWNPSWLEVTVDYVITATEVSVITIRLSDFLYKVEAVGTVHCNFCKKSFSYAARGLRTILSHCERRKHVNEMLKSNGIVPSSVVSTLLRKRSGPLVEESPSADEFYPSGIQHPTQGFELVDCRFCNFPFSSYILRSHESWCENSTRGSKSVKRDCKLNNTGEMTLSDLQAFRDELLKYLTSSETPFRCVKCQQEFKKEQRSKFFRHVQSHAQTSESLGCKYCNEKVASMKKLQKHVLHHARSIADRCRLCGLIMWQIRNMKNQAFWLKLTHKCIYESVEDEENIPATLKCRVCAGKEFSSGSVAFLHGHLHAAAAPFPCDLCDQSYATRVDRVLHKKSEHKLGDNSLNLCKVCGKQVRGAERMRLHDKACTAIKQPFFCALCELSFRTAALLKRHVGLIHNPNTETLKTCPYCCNFSSGFQIMATHISQTHISPEISAKYGKEAFKTCLICFFSCDNMHNLFQHIESKHPEKVVLSVVDCPPKCTICHQSVENMYLHMKEHVASGEESSLKTSEIVAAVGRPVSAVDISEEGGEGVSDNSFSKGNSSFSNSFYTDKKEKIVSCPFCKQFTAPVSLLKLHITQSHVGKSMISKMGDTAFRSCFFCGLDCGNFYNVIQHQKARHKGQTFPLSTATCKTSVTEESGPVCEASGGIDDTIALPHWNGYIDFETEDSGTIGNADKVPPTDCERVSGIEIIESSDPPFSSSFRKTNTLTCPFCLTHEAPLSLMKRHVTKEHVGKRRIKSMGRRAFKCCFFCGLYCGSFHNVICHQVARHNDQILPQFMEPPIQTPPLPTLTEAPKMWIVNEADKYASSVVSDPGPDEIVLCDDPVDASETVPVKIALDDSLTGANETPAVEIVLTDGPENSGETAPVEVVLNDSVDGVSETAPAEIVLSDGLENSGETAPAEIVLNVRPEDTDETAPVEIALSNLPENANETATVETASNSVEDPNKTAPGEIALNDGLETPDETVPIILNDSLKGAHGILPVQTALDNGS